MKRFLVLSALLLILVQSQAKEFYGVLVDSTLTIYYDDMESSRDGTKYGLRNSYGRLVPQWSFIGESGKIKHAIFDASVADYYPEDLCRWFYFCNNLTDIEGIEYTNTWNLTTAYQLFYYCEKLKSLDVSGFKTDNVTDMNGMFQGCSSLTSLDVSGFKTGNVTDMAWMFRGCSSLTSLDVSGFKTGNVTDMAWMFRGCSALTSLDVSGFKTGNVTDMAAMFDGCSGLTSLDVSGFKTDKVTDMSYMFHSCSGLTSLDLSGFKTSNVTNMSNMFGNCSGLTRLDLSGFETDNLTDMTFMFQGCSSLTSLDVSGFKNGNVTDMHYLFSSLSNLTSLNISGFKTDNVTTMEGMFLSCSKLTSLDLSGFKTENVTDMSDMFLECSSLTSLDLSGFKTDNVTNMAHMFGDCPSLTSLDVSGFKTDNVTNMEGMFVVCSGLTSLDVGGFKTDNVTNMSEMFSGCSSLKTIFANEENWSTANVVSGIAMFADCIALVGANGTVYDESHTNEEYARIDKEGQPGYFTAKDNIIVFADALVKEKCVANWDTDGDEELSYDEAAAVKDLGVLLWRTKIVSFDELQYFTGLDSISKNAFRNCSSLTSVTIPNSVTSIGGYAFSGCSSLASITIPGTVTGIGDDAFYNCSALTSITIPEAVTSIGEHAFSQCSALTSITIPESVTSIGSSPFYGCSGLTSIAVESGNKAYDSRDNCNAIINTETNELIAGCQNTVIPNSVTGIGDGAFYGCSGLTAITIPNAVTSIGYSAFSGCTGLTAVNIPNSVTTIGDSAFYGCSGLTSVTISESVTSIGSAAFQGCSSLSSVTIPKPVTSIGSWAFEGCSGLATITVEDGNTVYDSRNNCNAIIHTETNELIAGCKSTVIPNTVTSIADFAFRSCHGLTSVTIPNSVTSIGRQAFDGCVSLAAVTIPNSVTSIGSDAFSSCYFLTQVYSYITEPFPLQANAFSHQYADTLYVPAGTKALYEATEGWKGFKSIVEMSVLEPVGDDTDVSFGKDGDINEGTDLTGTVVNNMYYSIGTDAGGYSAEEGCIVITRETSDEQMAALEGLGISDAELNQNFTGIIFKVPAGEGTVTVNAETTGNMTLKVKVGSGKTVEMELSGKLKMKFPYEVNQESMVYIFAGTTDAASARGSAANTGSLKIYGIELQTKAAVAGDVNGDGNVDVGDIMAVINAMAAASASTVPGGFAAGSSPDVNGDGHVDVGDVMAIINIMAGN